MLTNRTVHPTSYSFEQKEKVAVTRQTKYLHMMVTFTFKVQTAANDKYITNINIDLL